MTITPEMIVIASTALSLGLLFGWIGLARGPKVQLSDAQETIHQQRIELATAQEERHELQRRAEELQATVTELRISEGQLRTELAAQQRAHTEKLSEVTDVQRKFETQIENQLKVTMNTLLEGSSKNFVEKAEALLKGQREQGETGMKTLVTPLKEALDKFQTQVSDMETKRKRDEGSLMEKIRQVSESHIKLNDTTTSLVNALKSAPKTRGRWGELQLENVLELAGMAEHVDYETEKHFATEEGGRRPDAILHMPGGRTLIVDAKTSLDAYLRAMEADTEEEREHLLNEHARQTRSHVDNLAKKKYDKVLRTDTVDFVVMFVPGEPMYAAAMARMADLFEYAWNNKVIICSPTTLLGLAKAIAYGWRQEKASKEAQRIHDVATELYKRLTKMGNDIAGMTKSLNSHVSKHNAFIGSLERSVLPQARKMTELSIGQEEIEQLEPVEQDVRIPLAKKDLEIDQPLLMALEEGEASPPNQKQAEG